MRISFWMPANQAPLRRKREPRSNRFRVSTDIRHYVRFSANSFHEKAGRCQGTRSLSSFLYSVPIQLSRLFCAYVIWEWVRWFKLGEVVNTKWRACTTVAGFCFATFSMALSVFLFVHAVFTDGYPFYHPVELFCIRFGFSGSLPCCSTKANRVFECRNKRADFKMVPTRKPP